MGLSKTWVLALLSAVVGYGFPCATGAQVPNPAAPQAPVAIKLEDPPHRGLDASLYMQTAAEYRACCYQAYHLAALRLRNAAAARKPGEKLAVVMDLDETVLDNAGFQAMQLRSLIAFD